MNKYNERNFEQIIELCLYVNLFELLNLATDDNYATDRRHLNNQDIFNLLICNKYLNRIITNKMLKCTYFSLEAILGLQLQSEKRKFYENNICNLCIDSVRQKNIIQLYRFKKLISIVIRYDTNLENIEFIDQNDKSAQNNFTNRSNIKKITFGFYYDLPIKN